MLFEKFTIVNVNDLPRFEVKVEFMSGDADAEEYEVTSFAQEQDVLAYLGELEVFQKYQDDGREYNVAKIAAALDWSEDDVEDFISNLPWDVTCDSYKARLVGWEIFAYADNAKYELKVRA